MSSDGASQSPTADAGRLGRGVGRPVPERAAVEALMKRCQIGVGGRNALGNAHDLMAECYGTLGALIAEVERQLGVIGHVNSKCDHLGMRLGEVIAERNKLRAFAGAVMDCWPEGDVDGAHLQDMAVEHGLLAQERRFAPCGEGCNCAAAVDQSEWAAGVGCYRRTALLKPPNDGANRAAEGRSG